MSEVLELFLPLSDMFGAELDGKISVDIRALGRHVARLVRLGACREIPGVFGPRLALMKEEK
jgi:hypothetical protein